MAGTMRERVVRALAWSAVRHWGTQAISFVVFLVLARELRPEAFGLVALASVYIAFLQMFVDQGLGDALIQRKNLTREHLDTAFLTAACAGILLAGLSYLSAGAVAAALNEAKLKPVIRLLSLGFILVAVSSTQQAILRRELAFKSLAIRSVAGSLCGGVVGVVMALKGFGVWSLVGQQLSSALISAIVLWSVSSWRPRLAFSRSHFHELFHFSASTLGINVLNFLNRRLDDLLIGAVLGPVALGYYSVGYRFLRILTSALTGVSSQVAFPVFSQVQDEVGRVRAGFLRATRYTSHFSFPIFIGFALVAPEFVEVLYGAKWSPSVPVMQVLAFIGILHSVYYFNESVMSALGKPQWRLRLALINAVGNAVVFAIAVRWGIVAVAAAYTLRGYLFSPLSLLAIRRLVDLDLNIYLRQFLAPIAGCVTMVLTVLGMRLIWTSDILPSLQLLVHGAAGAASYLVVIGWLNRDALAGPVLRSRMRRPPGRPLAGDNIADDGGAQA